MRAGKSLPLRDAVINGERVLLVEPNENEDGFLLRARTYLAAEGIIHWRNHQLQSEKGRAGVGVGGSDLIACVAPYGRMLVIELKKPGARTEPARLRRQKRFIAVVRKGGGVGGFATNLDEVVALVAEARTLPMVSR